MSNTTHFSYQLRKVSSSEPLSTSLSTKLILEQAENLGISWSSIPGTQIIKLQYKDKIKYFRHQISSETTDIGFAACLDKSTTNSLLLKENISVANGYKIERKDSKEYWNEVYSALNKPLVVKPSNGLQGKSIFMNLNSREEYEIAIERAFEFSTDDESGVMVEEMFSGKEYRVLTTREKVVGIVQRIPANVVGDGCSSIQQLIDQKNSDPRRGRDLSFALFIIEINDDLQNNLKKQNVNLETIPKNGQHIYLRSVSNIMQGGDSVDMTDLVHPSVKEIAVKAINAIPGLGFAGVDFMSKDIMQLQTPDSYIIIEINSSPGLCIHEFPYEGTRRYTDREFLYVMFPELKIK